MKKSHFLWSRFLGHGKAVKTCCYHKNGYGNEFLDFFYTSKKCDRCPPRVKVVIDENSDEGFFKVAP
jgi:hypothetical protein